MKRHPALIPLSRQHHNGLALVVLTHRSFSKDPSPKNLERLARKIYQQYETELKNHFEVEEQILFPALVQFAELQLLVNQLLAEHRQIEKQIHSLSNKPSAELLSQFLAALRQHIRTEEDELFEGAQQLLPEDLWESLRPLIEHNTVQVCLTWQEEKTTDDHAQ